MSALTFFARLGKAVGLEPLAKEVAGATVQRMVGFWVMWHLAGGFEGLLATGWLSQTAVYRSRGEFHRIMGMEVEAFWPEAIAFIESERKRLAA
jgi:hypothetical protein